MNIYLLHLNLLTTETGFNVKSKTVNNFFNYRLALPIENIIGKSFSTQILRVLQEFNQIVILLKILVEV